MQFTVNAEIAYCAVVGHCMSCNFPSMRIRLETFRKKLGLTLEQMSERIDASDSQLSRWEKGVSNIPSKRLPELAKAYECSVSDIFAEDSAPEIRPLSEADLAAMLALAQQEIGVGTPHGEWPRIVASNLHEQLRQIESAGGLRVTPVGATAHDTTVQSPVPTKPGGTALSRKKPSS